MEARVGKGRAQGLYSWLGTFDSRCEGRGRQRCVCHGAAMGETGLLPISLPGWSLFPYLYSGRMAL